MDARQRAVVTPRGLKLASGRELPLLSGAMHYWRLPVDAWRPCLEAMVDMGFPIVETYVPWRVHETSPGQYDFSTAEKNVVHFLELAHELGLMAIVRPGPHINAELTGFGFPDRVFHTPDMLSRTARGTPVWMPAPPRMFPVPSYASESFRAAASHWLEASARVLAPLLAPEGPICAVQVDNEFQMFFRLGAYDHDYHPDALRWWSEVAPGEAAPRRWETARQDTCVKWVQFKDEYAVRSLAWVAAAMQEGGLEGIPWLHNLPPTAPELAALPRLEEALSRRQEAVVGVDFYQRTREYQRYRRRALYLAGSAKTLPYAPEVGLGGPLWIEPMPAAEQENVTRGLLMGGVRAMNLYMAVQRDRWYGAPISETGLPDGELAPFVRRLLKLWKQVGFEALHRRADVALVMSRASIHLATASGLADPVTPVVLSLSLGGAGPAMLARKDEPLAQHQWATAAATLLDEMSVPYVLVDELCPPERLDRYGLVITVPPAAEREARLHALPGLVAPHVPTRWVAVDGAPLDTALFEDDAGQTRLLFAANRSGEMVHGALRWESALVDAFAETPDPLPSARGLVRITLGPGEVRTFLPA